MTLNSEQLDGQRFGTTPLGASVGVIHAARRANRLDPAPEVLYVPRSAFRLARQYWAERGMAPADMDAISIDGLMVLPAPDKRRKRG